MSVARESESRSKRPLKGSWLTLQLSPEHTLPSRTTNNARNLERQSDIEGGNGYFAKGMVLTCGTHVQQPHHTYILIKLTGNNTL